MAPIQTPTKLRLSRLLSRRTVLDAYEEYLLTGSIIYVKTFVSLSFLRIRNWKEALGAFFTSMIKTW